MRSRGHLVRPAENDDEGGARNSPPISLTRIPPVNWQQQNNADGAVRLERATSNRGLIRLVIVVFELPQQPQQKNKTHYYREGIFIQQKKNYVALT